MDLLRHLPLGLDRHKPFAIRPTDGDVLHRAQHIATVAIAHPAELREEDTAVGLIKPELFGVGVAKAIVLSPLLEAGKIGPLGEEIGISPLQVFEGLLQGMNRGIGQPRGLRAVAPFGEQLAQPGVAEFLLAALVPFLLQRQSLIEHEATAPGETTHLVLPFTVGLQFVFKRLLSLHRAEYSLVYGR